jgi:repressor LexA
MNKEELSNRQKVVLDAIKHYTKVNGFSPNIRELCLMCDVTSTATIYDHLVKLEKKGYITRLPGSSRTIKVIKEKNK